MKLYLSSYRIPVLSELEKLLGKPLERSSVAFIPNAKDYYSERARNFKIRSFVSHMQQLGLTVDVVDLREYNDPDTLKQRLAGHDLIWAMGGNTFMLRYEMKRSGFEEIIPQLLDQGVVYGGDSAGAIVAGISIEGLEASDEPEFAEAVINEGMGLVPYFILPHVGNPQFSELTSTFNNLHKQSGKVIELSDLQAIVFDGDSYRVITASE
jgi:dipeptidase E